MNQHGLSHSLTAAYNHYESTASTPLAQHITSSARAVEIRLTPQRPEVVQVLRRTPRDYHVLRHCEHLLPAVPQSPPALEQLRVAMEVHLVGDVGTRCHHGLSYGNHGPGRSIRGLSGAMAC